MTGTKKTWQKRLIAVLLAAALLFCVIVEIGEMFPATGLPGWDEVFVAAGLAVPETTVSGTLETHVLCVGNADCILVRQGDSNLLIDAGERGDAQTILDYLNAHGVKKLDLVIATHPHADHIGSMATVLRSLPVGQFIMAFMPEKKTPTSSVYLSMLEALDEQSIPVAEAAPGMTFPLGDAQVQLLAPIRESEDANNMSVVSYITFGSTHFLFTGDAEKGVEDEILAAGFPVAADVLKVGHHGSNTASGEAFLRRVAPTYAVITCGEGNSYGHPHKEVLQRLKQLGITICRSDVLGDMVFVSDGTAVTMTSEKG